MRYFLTMSFFGHLLMVPVLSALVALVAAIAMSSVFYIPEVIRTRSDRELGRSIGEIFTMTFVYSFIGCCVLLFIGELSHAVR